MKRQPKNTARTPAGVCDLRPDCPVSDKPDAVRFPVIRAALQKTDSGDVAIETLTEDVVRGALVRNHSNRIVEYLCRTYLQFGPEAMSAHDLQRLCDVINKPRTR